MPQTVIILGGGVGGLVTASRLRKLLPLPHRVVLVDREASFVFAPSFLWLMIGYRNAEQISRPLSVLEKKGIEFVQGEVEQIDPEQRRVVVNGQVLSGDYLVIALGAELAPASIPGLAEGGHNVYALCGVQELRDALAAFTGGRLAILTATPTYKSLATPYEAALFLEGLCRKNKIREKTRIDVYAAESWPAEVAGPKVSTTVLEVLLSRGIVYHIAHQIDQVDPCARRLKFERGLEEDYDLLVYVPAHRAPRVVREAGLTDETGWIPVDRHTLETKFAGVFALGDIVSIPLKCRKPLPKAGVFAHREAEVVAKNIGCAITGKGKPTAFDGRGAFFFETGDGKAGFGNGNFYDEPLPQVKFRTPSRHWHAAKVLFEKEWFLRWF